MNTFNALSIFKFIIIGIPLAVMFFILCILAFGPAYIQARDWWRAQKNTEYEQKHGFKPRKKKYYRGYGWHF